LVEHVRIAVIGGGVGGLTAALTLRDRGHEVIVFEAEATVGGKVRTEMQGLWRVELGPTALSEGAPSTQSLLHRLGLESEVILSEEEACHRFVFRQGRLRELPTSPPKLLFSRALSASAKLRLLREMRVPPSSPNLEESVAEFARRRFGAEIAEYIAEPMATGVFAGDYERLSLRAAFPKVAELEQQHGSLLRALRARARERRASGVPRRREHLLSLKGGLEHLPRALHRELGNAVRLSAPVSALRRIGMQWELRTKGERVVVDRVLLAIPASNAAPLLSSVDEEMSITLSGIVEVGIACVSLGYRRTDLVGVPVGFGFLVPKREGPRLLGAVFVSDVFPTAPQAPSGHALLRCMLGGARDPFALELEDEELVALARADLEKTTGLRHPPRFSHVVRWRSAIAQYEFGHADRIARLEARGRALGLGFAGAAFHGVGVNDVIADALPAAERLLKSS
jgi:oxygen-dependent protoporphyrinogen oxidase